MPDDKKISELTTAESNSSSDLFETAIPNALSETGFVSRKVTANALALLYANTIQFSSQLQTTAKTLIGAINEVAQGGSSSSVILGTTDPTSATGSNGNLYIKYDGTSYAVLGMWVKINNDWRAVELGGASDLGDLDDVTFTTPAERQCVTYDNANGVWINRDVVKPMAQSDYDNLPSAKQQDGTLYITDGTPPSATVTGSDVLYFSDVSDSNKPKATTAAAVAALGKNTSVSSASFTANSSNAANTVLSDDINLVKGLYLISLAIPVMSVSAFSVQVVGTNITKYGTLYPKMIEQATMTFLLSVNDATDTICLKSAESTAVTFSYLERGGLYAYKLA